MITLGKAWASAVALPMSLLAASATAQTIQTTNVATEPVFVEGQFRGCTLVFDVILSDTRFRAGEETYAAGSLTLLEANGNLGVGLRLGLASASADGPMEAPETAYLVVGTRSGQSDLRSSFESDVPGYRNFAFGLGDATSEGLIAFMTGEGTVAYTRQGGSAAQLFTVQVPPEAAERFYECTGDLLRAVQPSQP
ncbi:hypothetical protein [Brevundimonas sp.]|uniref:hypothetical protein n=1 Tax=Brevundimonas sp. TaxID=1871086 RepID=UPI00260EC923|nr:hypothetical protein [Brevundimonas sp.]